MQTKDILIATALILTLSSLLNGCDLLTLPEKQASAPAQPATPSIDLEKARAVHKTVNIAMKAEAADNQVTVRILLNNPDNKPVTSVQSWLSFDPEYLQGREIDTSESAFSLMAPYDNTFDNENGLVMLGRANPEPVTDKNSQVAEVVFDRKKSGVTMIDVYDYQQDLSGHASANSLASGKPYNILKKPASPALIVEK